MAGRLQRRRRSGCGFYLLGLGSKIVSSGTAESEITQADKRQSDSPAEADGKRSASR
jgi:hypothetical protein